jgi:hypothetical protein
MLAYFYLSTNILNVPVCVLDVAKSNVDIAILIVICVVVHESLVIIGDVNTDEFEEVRSVIKKPLGSDPKSCVRVNTWNLVPAADGTVTLNELENSVPLKPYGFETEEAELFFKALISFNTILKLLDKS